MPEGWRQGLRLRAGSGKIAETGLPKHKGSPVSYVVFTHFVIGRISILAWVFSSSMYCCATWLGCPVFFRR